MEVFGVATIISVAMWLSGRVGESDEDCEKYGFRFSIICGPLFIVALLGCTFIPSTKQMATILVLPKVVNFVKADSSLQKLPADITGLADEWIKKLSPDAAVAESKKVVNK